MEKYQSTIVHLWKLALSLGHSGLVVAEVLSIH
jgi:hypothetical protein